MHLGYARVSTDAQDLTNQRTELAAAGCTKLFSEKLTERSATARSWAGCWITCELATLGSVALSNYH
ncbi:hypothetical protein H4V98_004021 [Polaromonas sp. CG_23.6]|nr:recombinase family protein [Polaromonas sp. CG_23.6]MDH6186573.1 hypothetical protein [Polaromonas sp. CG_23.6]